jgi:hypothetical protein
MPAGELRDVQGNGHTAAAAVGFDLVVFPALPLAGSDPLAVSSPSGSTGACCAFPSSLRPSSLYPSGVQCRVSSTGTCGSCARQELMPAPVDCQNTARATGHDTIATRAPTSLALVAELVRLLRLMFRSRAQLAAENLFLRKQLACYIERQFDRAARKTLPESHSCCSRTSSTGASS